MLGKKKFTRWGFEPANLTTPPYEFRLGGNLLCTYNYWEVNYSVRITN
jgi:hypothetical protein